ncbi:tRNA lysidine(34) synthetase TilS [Portibacter marinus]|uniref:tRNA lysidine(34) synthetase TilS n=1 Tax=Portibacter marinus TaxID=2898660 RepID=UPI001F382377|nr:tRNA lysidine(34) synthetase TilS [Portibacter marinus]
MLDKFNHFISNQELVHKSQKILIACSGGVDSMCMTELFRRGGYDIGLAHLNHGLRGVESDKDEKLCEDYARRHHLEIHHEKMDLSHIQSNFQAEARQVRYEWLFNILRKHDYDVIATAHHKDDDIENFFIRIHRNSGLKGLSGIKPKNGKIIRPLLFASKEDILLYAQSKEIPFREDESNKKSKYRRNFFRNKIIPKIEKRIPGYKYNIHSTIEKINEANVLLNHLIVGIEEDITFKESDHIFISLDNLKTFPSARLILFYILNKYGLNRTQSDNLYEAGTGAIIQSDQLIFLKNRSEIVIKKRVPVQAVSIPVNLFETEYHIGQMKILKMTKVQNEGQFNSSDEIYVSPSKLHLPLKIRARREGDVFYPLGMNMKTKKVKKFLIDQKLNKFEKQALRILEDAHGNIVWLIGLRADERFKIASEETDAVKIVIRKHSG